MNGESEVPSEALSLELLWGEEGHASELAITLMADEEVGALPGVLTAHVDQCAACTDRLADAVVLSLSVETELRAAGLMVAGAAATARDWDRAPMPHVALESLRFPVAAVALGVVVAALGASPVLLQAPTLPLLVSQVVSKVPVLLRAVRVMSPVFAEQVGTALMLASLFAVALFLTGGWLVSRAVRAPRDFAKGRAL